MNQEEKLQKLLRLKRHETPPEGFFEEFLAAFQKRQRAEMLQRGAFSLLWERALTWMDGFRRPMVVWSLAGAYALVLLLVVMWPTPGRTPSATIVIHQPSAPVNQQLATAPPRDPGFLPVSINPEEQQTPAPKKDKNAILDRKNLGPATPEPEIVPNPAPLPTFPSSKLKEL